MSAVTCGLKSFYQYYTNYGELKKDNNKEIVIKSSPCTRFMFALATIEALDFLVKNVALLILSTMTVIATLGLKESCKASFLKEGFEGVVHICSIPVSIAGIIVPDVINKKFLGINEEKIINTLQSGSGKALSTTLNKDLTMRVRAPLYG